MTEDWPVTIESWFRDGDDTSDSILGLPWDIEKADVEKGTGIYLLASHPRFPVPVNVQVIGPYTHMIADLKITTDVATLEERMRTYRNLLRMNHRLYMVKATLGGESDNVLVEVHLDHASLSREEFDNALSSLIGGAYRIYRLLELESEVAASMQEHFMDIIRERIKSGSSQEDNMEFLITRVGMERDEAETLLRIILRQTDKPGGKEDGDGTGDDSDLGDDDPSAVMFG